VHADVQGHADRVPHDPCSCVSSQNLRTLHPQHADSGSGDKDVICDDCCVLARIGRMWLDSLGPDAALHALHTAGTTSRLQHNSRSVHHPPAAAAACADSDSHSCNQELQQQHCRSQARLSRPGCLTSTSILQPRRGGGHLVWKSIYLKMCASDWASSLPMWHAGSWRPIWQSCLC